MAKFVKKPIVIEAMQWFPDNLEIEKQIEGSNLIFSKANEPPICFKIPTLEGDMYAMPGDWIITGIKGEKYPCKPDIFEATYDPVE